MSHTTQDLLQLAEWLDIEAIATRTPDHDRDNFSGAARAMRSYAAAFDNLRPPAAEAPAPEPVAPTYTNWRGETHTRRILPLSIWYGKTEWHLDPQWFLRARDVERGVERDFALKDLGSDSPADAGDGAKGLGRALEVELPSEHEAWAQAQDAVDRGEDGPTVVLAFLRSLASPAPQENQ